ncbi:MAG: hypothetical protein ACYC3V_17810, partial [Chloroflexota bacterium]
MGNMHPEPSAHDGASVEVRQSGEDAAYLLPEAIKYPDLTPVDGGEAAATGVLRTWIREAFDRSTPSSWIAAILAAGQDIRPHPLPISRGGDVWRELVRSPALWVWMSILSREQGIASVFGRTEKPFDDAYWKLHDVALDFVNHLFLLSTGGFEDVIFLREARKLWTYLHEDRVTYEGGFFIPNLRGPGDPIDLGEGITLRPASSDWAATRLSPLERLPQDGWAISSTYSVPRSPETVARPDEHEEVETALVERSLLRLRLTFPTHFLFFDTLYRDPYRLAVHGSFEAPRRAIVMDVPVIEPWYPILDLDDQAQFRLKSLRTIIPPEETIPELLSLAIRYFQSSFKRHNWEDRIIDLAICLEAFFSRDREEITHKVVMRAALLLGTSPGTSKRLAETVRHLYALRSAIVHAKAHKKRDTEVEKTIAVWHGGNAMAVIKKNRGYIAASVAAEIVAASLRALLQLRSAGEEPFPKDASSFTRRLDDLAFDADQRTSTQRLAGILPTEEELLHKP